MPSNYLTLIHRALYSLVWSKPMSAIVKDFGISAWGLANRCAGVSVPVPPRHGP
jgi:hypothetical protein